jgi:hypothetical protein
MQVFNSVVDPNFMGFQESIEFVAGIETQQAAQFGLRDMAALVFLET